MILESLFRTPKILELDPIGLEDLRYCYERAAARGAEHFDWLYDDERYQFTVESIGELIEKIDAAFKGNEE